MTENRHRDSPYEDIICLHVPQNKKILFIFFMVMKKILR